MWGWAVNRRDGGLVDDLRVEAVRDGVVIASSVPGGPRPDVPGNGEAPAAFCLVCDGKATIADLLDGVVTLRAVDALGMAAEVLRLGRGLALAGKAAAAVGPKIVLVGAGSTVFAKNLIGDILLHPALRGSRICLYDIDPERLRVSEIVAGRIPTACTQVRNEIRLQSVARSDSVLPRNRG